MARSPGTRRRDLCSCFSVLSRAQRESTNAGKPLRPWICNGAPTRWRELSRGRSFSQSYFRLLFKAEPHDIARDEALLASYARFSDFIQPRHLNLSEKWVNADWLHTAVTGNTHAALRAIGDYDTPRAKLACVQQCYAAVVGPLLHASIDTSCTEAVLPLFTFVVLKARTEQLFRNYYFIKKFRYRAKGREDSEDRSLLATLKVTIRFVVGLSLEKMRLEPEEDVPPEEPPIKSIGVQAGVYEEIAQAPIEFAGPLDAEYFCSHPDALGRLVSEFCALRLKYLGK